LEKKHHYTPSKISWIKYDIDWPRVAKSNCKSCHGRGYEGFEVLPEAEEIELKKNDPNWQPKLMLCDCCANKWVKMNDIERMEFATLKENAEEIHKKAVEMVKEVAQDEAKKQGIELKSK